MPSRRHVLLALGAAAGAGCLAGSDPGDGAETNGTPVPPDERPDPSRHVSGSDGRWSSYGFDGANTRWLQEGPVPANGVEERWRREVGFRETEPIVADSRLYDVGEELHVLDAKSGEELWSAPTDRGLTPLVFEDLVYHVDEDWSLLAREVETGDVRWEDGPGARTSPASVDGRRLFVGDGETLRCIDAETGEEKWSRELFGRINDGIAVWMAYAAVVTTEAGRVYGVSDAGAGVFEHALPARTEAALTVGKEYVYVGAMDGHVHAIDPSGTGDGFAAWSAPVGGYGGQDGLAYDRERVYVAAGRDLVAIDAGSGSEAWSTSLGESARTAPLVAGDTVFVGGESLFAFDRSGGTGIGPLRFGTERFSETYGESVGRGPVLDDGVLYTYAFTDGNTQSLLALEPA
jgi:outer membrane protein assembly factor BamB